MFFRRSGFTLIELLIVVIVLGVLAAAAMPRYQSFVMEARSRNCMTNLRNVEQAVGVWETRNFPMPSSVDYPWIYMYFDVGTGNVATGAGSVNGGAMSANYAGPIGAAVVDIVQEAKTFVCPEVVNRYGSQDVASGAFVTPKGTTVHGSILGYSFGYRYEPKNWPAPDTFCPTNAHFSVGETFGMNQKRNATCLAFGIPTASTTLNATTIAVAQFPAPTPNPIFMRGTGPDLTTNFLHYGKK